MARVKTSKPIKIGTVIKDTYNLIINNKKSIFIISLIYGILYLLFVQALSSPLSATSIKNSFLNSVNKSSNFGASYHTFNALLTNNISTNSSTASSATNAAYQVVLLIIFSLVFIFLFRNAFNKNKITTKEAFYKSSYPLIPYLLSILIVFIELIPFEIGLALYSVVVLGKNLTSGLENGFFLLIFIALTILSLYFVAVSLIATYVVTLEDMTPINALRSAKDVIKGRRLSVIVAILTLPILMIVLATVILIPAILVLPSVASWLYIVLFILALPLFHAYMYSLYREIIK